MSDFCFNGVWASDLGLTVEHYPDLPIPRKRLTTDVIPGRSDPLTQWDGSFEPVVKRYVCWFKSSPVAAQAHRVKEWLLSAPAGARLEDTYDPDVFFHGTYAGGGDIANVLDRFGRLTLEFTCGAQAWLKQGQEPVRVVPGQTVVVRNDGFRPAHPLIRLQGNGKLGCVVKIGGDEIDILWSGAGNAELYFDCAMHEAWELVDGVETPVNELVRLTVHSFPALQPGDNPVELRGLGADYMELIPRTWTV